MKVDMWITGNQNLLNLLSSPEEKRIFNIHFSEVDMTSYGWIKVGTADVVPNFYKNGVIEAGAIRAIDSAIDEVNKKFAARIKELQDQRASLLSLPMSVEVVE